MSSHTHHGVVLISVNGKREKKAYNFLADTQTRFNRPCIIFHMNTASPLYTCRDANTSLLCLLLRANERKKINKRPSLKTYYGMYTFFFDRDLFLTKRNHDVTFRTIYRLSEDIFFFFFYEYYLYWSP